MIDSKNNNNLLIDRFPDLLAEWDYEKNNANNIDVNTVTYGSHKIAAWKCSAYGHSFEMSVNDRYYGRGCPYCSNRKVLAGFNDLMSKYPELIESEWDWAENNNNKIHPDEIGCFSHVKASWHCTVCKGSYDMTVANKISGQGCPYCAGVKVLPGFNDLLTLYPKLIKSEWDYEKNNIHNIHPDMLTKGSHVMAYWHCETCGGHYDMRVYHRISGHQSCPFCAGVRVLAGFNDLLTLYPELIELEWDWNMNNNHGIKPDKLTSGSEVLAYWHCNVCMNDYKSSIHNRVTGHGCPYCSNNRIKSGFNDLKSEHPELIIEWDYEKNNKTGLKPDEIPSGSHKLAAWKCSAYKHEYMMVVKERANGQGCPFCANKKVLRGFNDLQTKYPDLISSSWDYSYNNAHGIYPDAVTYGSSVEAGWHCETCGGSYVARVYSKTNGGRGCPYCANKKILRGFNDLMSKYPEIVNNEWDWVNNDADGIKPNGITAGTCRQVYFRCDDCKGSYKMAVNVKTAGNGCPYCSNHRVLTGFNDLQSCYPELVESEWNWNVNNTRNIHPYKITCFSHQEASWKCHECGHEWFAPVVNRTSNKTGCPECAKHRNHHISAQENQVAEFISNYLCTHYVYMHYTMFRSIKFKRIYENLGIDTENNLSADLQAHLLKEIDIYIPEFGLAVEYDGDYWHDDAMMLSQRGLTNTELHVIKQQLCSQAGIELLFISEHDWLHDSDNVRKRIIGTLNEAIQKYKQQN